MCKMQLVKSLRYKYNKNKTASTPSSYETIDLGRQTRTVMPMSIGPALRFKVFLLKHDDDNFLKMI